MCASGNAYTALATLFPTLILTTYGRSAGELPEREMDRESVPPATEATPSHDDLSQSDIDGVETFLLFVGWPRSCHSIIGSMLDAHPNAVVANEYFIFRKLSKNEEPSINKNKLFRALYRNTYTSVVNKGWRDPRSDGKGYTLNIKNSWQGRFTELKLIGDKSADITVKGYMKDGQEIKKLYQQLAASVKVPIKVLQIIRNPLDMIATHTLYKNCHEKHKKLKATPTHKYRNFKGLKQTVSTIVNISKAVMTMIPDLGLSPLEVHCEDLIADPAKTLSDICRFLDLECPADYLKMCVDKTFKTVSESRHTVDWDPNTLPLFIKELRTFPFFQRYNLSTTDIR